MMGHLAERNRVAESWISRYKVIFHGIPNNPNTVFFRVFTRRVLRRADLPGSLFLDLGYRAHQISGIEGLFKGSQKPA
jgi:hypothetical protein